tara:strand:+ start:42 stop:323 length:282 start_codon:yes stop_codon:yes gene_type:complete
MSPMISGKKLNSDSFNIFDRKLLDDRDKLLKLRRYVENNFEFVGNKLSKKVREVYYDKKNNKSIYGTTTSKEREELAEEGIDLLSIPWVSKDN